MVTEQPSRQARRTTSRPGYFLWATLALLLAAFALRVWQVGAPSLWADEVMTEYRAQAPFWDATQNILKTIDQVPLYFWLLRLFPTGNEFLLRFPSVLAGVLGVALAMGVARRLYASDTLALIVGGWLTFNPFHIWLSRTARAYTLIFVWAVLLSYLFLTLWRGENRRRYWVAFTLASLTAYLTHYSLLALPFVQTLMVGWALRRRWDFARRWVLAQAIAVVPMLVWLGLMLANYTPREPQWGEPPRLRDLALTLWNLTAGYPGGWRWYVLPGLLVAVGGAVLALRTPKLRARNVYWLLLMLPLLLVFAVSNTPVNMYIDRYFMVVLPALAFVIASGWANAPRAAWRLALVAVMVGGVGNVADALSHEQHQREDWRGAAQYVAAAYQPDDYFVVDRAVTMTAFRRYFADERASTHVLQLTETEAPPPPAEEVGERFWVLYRTPDENIHQLLSLPEFDPFRPQHTAISQWLLPRLNYVVDYRAFDGVTVLLVNFSQPPSLTQGTSLRE